MNKKLMVIGAAIGAATGLASPAMAQDADDSGGIYVSASLGAVLSDDQLINGANAAGAPRRIVTGLDRGTSANIALGYATDDASWGRVRGEIEYGWQQSDLESLSLNAVDRTLIGVPGRSVRTGMVNVYYDTPTFLGGIRAEVGAGIGRSGVNYDIRYNVSATGPSIEIPSDRSQGAYQLMAGFSGRMSSRLELFTQFRYLSVSDHTVERFNRTANTLDSVLAAEYNTRSVTIGARYVF